MFRYSNNHLRGYIPTLHANIRQDVVRSYRLRAEGALMLLATRDVEVVIVRLEAPTSLVYHSRKNATSYLRVVILDMLNL